MRQTDRQERERQTDRREGISRIHLSLHVMTSHFTQMVLLLITDSMTHLSGVDETKRHTSGENPPAEEGGTGLREAQGG